MLRAAEWLSLAAAPTFAIMAKLTDFGSEGTVMVCGIAPGPSVGGMATMYVLMSGFHLPAWLRFIADLRNRAPTPG
jgi:hypothetical protein